MDFEKCWKKFPFLKNLVCLEDVSHLNIGFFATKPFSVFDIQVSSHRAEAEQFIKDFSSRDFVEKKNVVLFPNRECKDGD